MLENRLYISYYITFFVMSKDKKKKKKLRSSFIKRNHPQSIFPCHESQLAVAKFNLFLKFLMHLNSPDNVIFFLSHHNFSTRLPEIAIIGEKKWNRKKRHIDRSKRLSSSCNMKKKKKKCECNKYGSILYNFCVLTQAINRSF